MQNVNNHKYANKESVSSTGNKLDLYNYLFDNVLVEDAINSDSQLAATLIDSTISRSLGMKNKNGADIFDALKLLYDEKDTWKEVLGITKTCLDKNADLEDAQTFVSEDESKKDNKTVDNVMNYNNLTVDVMQSTFALSKNSTSKNKADKDVNKGVADRLAVAHVGFLIGENIRRILAALNKKESVLKDQGLPVKLSNSIDHELFVCNHKDEVYCFLVLAKIFSRHILTVLKFSRSCYTRLL